MRHVFFIARNDLLFMLRAKETIVWVFVMPILFFFFIGTVTSGFGPGDDEGPGDPVGVLVPSDAGFLSERIAFRLSDRGFAVFQVADEGSLATYERRVWLPAAMTDSILAGGQARLRFELPDEGTMNGPFDRFRVQRAAYTVLADLVVAGRGEETAVRERLARIDTTPRSLALNVRTAGERRRIPTGFEQTIPGTLVMFTLLVMATSGAILLVIERRQGLLRRLAYTPIGRGRIVAGKWLGKLGLGCVQIAFGMTAGTVLFGMDWGPSLGGVVIVMLSYGALMAAVGLFLGSVLDSEGQTIAVGVISANVLAALGGCWWPIEITPDWMQRLQLALPTGWAMDALHRLVSFGQGVDHVGWHLAVMGAATVAVLAVVARVFRYE